MEDNFEKFCNFHGNPHRSAPDPKRTFARMKTVIIIKKNIGPFWVSLGNKLI